MTNTIPAALQSLRDSRAGHRVYGVQTEKVVAEDDMDKDKIDAEADIDDSEATSREDTEVTQEVTEATPAPEKPTGEEQVHDYEKRYFDLKKHHDTTVAPMRKELDELKEALKAKQEEPKAPQTPEEISKFKEKYPDMYNTIEKMIVHNLKGSDAEVKKTLKDIEAARQEEATAKAQAKLSEAHPDWESVGSSSSFLGWIETQPPAVKKLAQSYDVEDAIYILDEYKKHVNRKTGQQKKKLEASKDVDVSGGSSEAGIPKGKKIWSEAEVAKMFRDNPRLAYDDKFMAEIDTARREGRYKM